MRTCLSCLPSRVARIGLAALCSLAALSPARPATAGAPERLQGHVEAEIKQTLFLIGDAGDPEPGGDPVLLALSRDLRVRPEVSTVVFLGDNIYPAGLPAEGDPDRAEAERRLDDQIDAVKDTGALVVFVPGNHDWDNSGEDGWDAIRRQEARVAERGGPTVRFLPTGGCPGPEVLDVGERLRIVALDTQWWLHEHEGPRDPVSDCPTDSRPEVIAALGEAMRADAGRDVVLVSHHPPVSGGPHGGKFSLRQHLFPLTDKAKWAWLPLPLIGSLYPIARGIGATAQDISSRAYQAMRGDIESALKERPPLAWAAGHEHVLQVIESRVHGRVLVSGTGIYGHVSHVGKVEGSRYRSSRSGYMRIDFLSDGRRRLSVVEVAKDHRTREAWTSFISSRPSAPRSQP